MQCKQCKSTNTFISKYTIYNSVGVCLNCHHEWQIVISNHIPVLPYHSQVTLEGSSHCIECGNHMDDAIHKGK